MVEGCYIVRCEPCGGHYDATWHRRVSMNVLGVLGAGIRICEGTTRLIPGEIQDTAVAAYRVGGPAAVGDILEELNAPIIKAAGSGWSPASSYAAYQRGK